MKRPVITLLTDFGLADHYVAAMKGVILAICPEVQLVDISHEITPYAIPEAAYTLAQTWKLYPKGTTHVAVVDPGVGSSRRAIVVEFAGHRFIAPDNGVLGMVLDAAAQGKVRAKIREISTIRYFRRPVSQTFHGRDVFAPVAAHLAKGIGLASLGRPILDPVLGGFTKPTQLAPNLWAGVVLKTDRFGNVITNLEWNSFSSIARGPFRLKFGRRTVTRFHHTYDAAPPDRLFALRGSSGYLEVSLRRESAAADLGVLSGSPFELVL